MCRTAAAAQGPEGARVLDAAILILFLPAMALFCGVFFFAVQRRNVPSGEPPVEHEGRPVAQRS
jgi:hypothetical protein